ncbi:Crp/Fnr family transcriptional regulator [Spirosoma spitsbergense]|uniref:Crp/Fnr family transcriptional regulator n=1 Tax=Spirosoma spitsbergense TaxID=431554 RepID=UPI00037E6196|nr:Crp/Fnr family transcriptional regulator [Spirosoma spitsbergense]
MFDSLRQTLETQQPLSDTDWLAFQSCLQQKRYAKNELLLQTGQVCRGIWFVQKGAVRSYVSKDGTEVHTGFSFENDFVTAYESMTRQEPSSVMLVALEPLEAIYFGRDELINLYQQAPSLTQLGRLILEKVIVLQQHYASLFTLYSPTERYQRLTEKYPHMVQRVPVQYIASYLGMARETLSRIRQKK